MREREERGEGDEGRGEGGGMRTGKARDAPEHAPVLHSFMSSVGWMAQEGSSVE